MRRRIRVFGISRDEGAERRVKRVSGFGGGGGGKGKGRGGGVNIFGIWVELTGRVLGKRSITR